MRFTVVTYGSEGDARPLVALCNGLIQAGHQVQFFTERHTVRFAVAHGVPTRELAGDLRSAANNPGLSPIEGAKVFYRLIRDNTPSWMKEVARDAVFSDAILCSGLAGAAGIHVAGQMSIPVVWLGMAPLLSPTREFGGLVLPPLRMPGWLNLLTHRLTRLMMSPSAKTMTAAHRQVFAQPPRRLPKHDLPALYGISRHLVPQPHDWSSTQRICGAWYARVPDFQPSAELTAFLDSGPPPIYVGFGSVSGMYGPKVFDALVAAVGDRRALFFPGWTEFDRVRLPGNFFVIGETSHDWLFPRTSMVIHHGGAGTSHSATRAGVPSVVIPMGVDQPFWASRLAAAGVAPQYVRSAKVTAADLSAMIEFASRPEVRERATALAAAMAQEDGVAYAVRFIEEFVPANRSGIPAPDRSSVSNARSRMLAS